MPRHEFFRDSTAKRYLIGMTFHQYIYGLAHPLHPEDVRYVGRTNDLDMRLRMHVAEAEYGLTIKDVWLMYLRYAGQEPVIEVIDDCTFDQKSEAERWAKERERFWIGELANRQDNLLNGAKWSGHRSRKSIPKGVKTAWCETHVLLWKIDRNWRDEYRLLDYLNQRYGAITKQTTQPNGSILCESMAEIDFAKSQFEGRRFRACSVLQSLLTAHPTLSVGDLQILRDCDVTAK